MELYADAGDGIPSVREVMARVRPLDGAGGYLYAGQVPANRAAGDYTPRIVPYKDGVPVPLEASEILWQR